MSPSCPVSARDGTTIHLGYARSTIHGLSILSASRRGFKGCQRSSADIVTHIRLGGFPANSREGTPKHYQRGFSCKYTKNCPNYECLRQILLFAAGVVGFEPTTSGLGMPSGLEPEFVGFHTP